MTGSSEQERYGASRSRRDEDALTITRFEGPLAVRLWKLACVQAFRKTPSFTRRAPRKRCKLEQHENDDAEVEDDLFEGLMDTNDVVSQPDVEDNGHDLPEKEDLLWEMESLGSSTLLSPESQQNGESSQLARDPQTST